VTNLHFPDDSLHAAANRADIEINRQVNGSDEVADVVRALEEQYDRFAEGAARNSLLAEGVDRMPTAEELGSEFERFLAEQQGNPDP